MRDIVIEGFIGCWDWVLGELKNETTPQCYCDGKTIKAELLDNQTVNVWYEFDVLKTVGVYIDEIGGDDPALTAELCNRVASVFEKEATKYRAMAKKQKVPHHD